MKQTTLTIPEIVLIGATRAALGAGVALLLCDKLTSEQRRAVGWTLLAVGALTTPPLLIDVLTHRTKGPQTREVLAEQMSD